MTYNNIIARIKNIALAHKQVKSFYKGLVSDFLTDKTTLYAAVFLQDNGGTISLSGHATTINFKLYFVDLVHVAADTKDNEQDVHSDMISVAQDILAQLNHPSYNDWIISPDNNLQLLVEDDGDMFAGCSLDISISFVYTQNVCGVPTTKITYSPSAKVAKLTLSEDAITGEMNLVLTPQTDVTAQQEIILPDYINGFILTTPLGTRASITVYQDAATMELSFVLTKLAADAVSDLPEEQQITITDFSQGFIITTALGTIVRVNLVQDSTTGELTLTLTKL